MDMKKRTASLLIAAACLLSAGCASKDSSSQNDSSSEATTTAAPEATSASAAPAPACEPQLDGGFMKNYEGISLNGQAAAIFRGNDGTVAIKCESQTEGNVYIFDAVSGRTARTIKTAEPYDKLLGVLKDGSVITQKAGQNLFYRYDEGSDTPKQIKPNYDGAAIFQLDAENECIYADGNSMDELVKISLSDNKTSVIKYDGVYSLRTPLGGANLFGAAEYDERGTRLLTGVYSLDSGEKVLSLHKKSQALYCTKDTICETGNRNIQAADFDLTINTYSLKEQKYLCTYSFSNESMINVRYYADKDSDKLFVSLGKTTPVGADDEKLSVIDLASGKMARLDSLLNENTVKSECCTVGTRGCWLLALTDKVGSDSKTRLVLIDPAKCSYDTQLKKETNDADENVVIQCGQGLESLRAEADRIEQKYNVRILIGDEVKNLDKDNLASFAGDTEYSFEMLMDYVTSLDKQLSLYPKGFFDKFKTNGRGGMTFALTAQHKDSSNLGFVPGGQSGYSNDRYIITIDAYRLATYDPAVHHEIWHAVDHLLENRGKKIDEKQWAALNPSDFKYLDEYKKYIDADYSDTLEAVDEGKSLDYSVAYFAGSYSFVNELEDRAKIIEEVYRWAFASDYKDPKKAYAEICRYTHIKAKIDFLAQASKSVFGCVYWEEAIKTAPLNE